MDITISIIGSAGRKGLLYKFKRDIYDKMMKECKEIVDEVRQVNETEDITLVSGGAAFADHLAVDLYLEGYVNKLVLHLPCDWDYENKQYVSTGEQDWRTNPGGTSNYCHNQFSARFDKNSLEEIHRAIEKGAVINSKNKGFHNRNNLVAKSDYILAFSTGNNEPDTSGTKYTWNKCKGEKIFVCLNDL